MNENTRVLVVDDTATYRSILSRIINNIDGLEVIDTAPNGKIALDKIRRLKPDIITLDLDMPVMNGLETLKHLSCDFPDIDVVIVSASDPRSAGQTFEALSLGCLEFIVKPSFNNAQDACDKLTMQMEHLFNIYKIRINRRHTRSAEPAACASAGVPPVERFPAKEMSIKNVDVILIGSSTGGPKALESVIPKLSSQLPVPVLIVQHMPRFFTKSFAESLDIKSAVTVLEGSDGEKVLPGHVYIAPGGMHMTVKMCTGGKRVLKLNTDPPENSCRPAVDVLFRSACEAYRPQNALCVIMTGMGSDGVKGVQCFRNEGGGHCLIQSKESSSVYGMARSIADAGLASEVLDLNDIADRINTLSAYSISKHL